MMTGAAMWKAVSVACEAVILKSASVSAPAPCFRHVKTYKGPFLEGSFRV
jgi:hypothetical protein